MGNINVEITVSKNLYTWWGGFFHLRGLYGQTFVLKLLYFYKFLFQEKTFLDKILSFVFKDLRIVTTFSILHLTGVSKKQAKQLFLHLFRKSKKLMRITWTMLEFTKMSPLCQVYDLYKNSEKSESVIKKIIIKKLMVFNYISLLLLLERHVNSTTDFDLV